MVRLFGILFAALSLSGCGTGELPADTVTPTPSVEESYNESADQGEDNQEESALKITVGEHTFYATFAENPSADEFQELLAQGAITVEMQDYGGFETVGSLACTTFD